MESLSVVATESPHYRCGMFTVDTITTLHVIYVMYVLHAIHTSCLLEIKIPLGLAEIE